MSSTSWTPRTEWMSVRVWRQGKWKGGRRRRRKLNPIPIWFRSPATRSLRAGRRMAADRTAAPDDDELLAGARSGEPILPPRLEDAGLEDCALPPASIAEAFSLAAAAVSSRLALIPLSDSDDEEDEGGPRAGGCVDVAGPARGVVPDVLICRGGGDEGADAVIVVGADRAVLGGLEEEEDKVLVVGEGRGKEEDKVVVVGDGRGEKKLGKEEGCVDGVGEGIGEPGRAQQGDGDDGEEEVVVAAEKAILVPDSA